MGLGKAPSRRSGNARTCWYHVHISVRSFYFRCSKGYYKERTPLLIVPLGCIQEPCPLMPAGLGPAGNFSASCWYRGTHRRSVAETLARVRTGLGCSQTLASWRVPRDTVHWQRHAGTPPATVAESKQGLPLSSDERKSLM